MKNENKAFVVSIKAAEFMTSLKFSKIILMKQLIKQTSDSQYKIQIMCN